MRPSVALSVNTLDPFLYASFIAASPFFLCLCMLQRVGLDFLNLRLIDYEESMDAFAGFRVHHLQPAPTSLREVCLQRPTQTEGETTATAFLVEELRLVRRRDGRLLW